MMGYVCRLVIMCCLDYVNVGLVFLIGVGNRCWRAVDYCGGRWCCIVHLVNC